MKCLQGRVKIPIGGIVRDWPNWPLTRRNSGTDSDVSFWGAKSGWKKMCEAYARSFFVLHLEGIRLLDVTDKKRGVFYAI